MPWGVGVIGAGPGVAALHLPTLERLRDEFTVVHVADHGSGRAEELAGRLGAAASTGTEGLLADPAVEVLAICSPPGEHARQIREGIAAGVRAILCEKPLATTMEDAREVVDALRHDPTAEPGDAPDLGPRRRFARPYEVDDAQKARHLIGLSSESQC